MTVVVKILHEEVVEGKRLGRHVEHDPLSRNHRFEVTVVGAAQLRTVHHERHGRPFDQGELGSCTGNACAGAINTDPLHTQHGVILHEAEAVDLYELATNLDDVPGTYPPDDTGSSGLAVSKAAQQKGYISAYKHAFGIDDALGALQVTPVITGINWYEGFDNPDDQGRVQISGQVRGGHEIEVLGYVHADNPEDAIVICENSWGRDWGRHGRFSFSVKTWAQLLDEEGDVTILVK